MSQQKTALLSVSDKTGIVTFAKQLSKLGYSIISTGGTAKLLRKNKVTVTEVADLTSFPEILDGRVKTLHPKIFGGILATGSSKHSADLKKHRISKIDLVCVNLYPFEQTVTKKNVKLAQAIEEIDIGGVSLLRAAAKNFEHVVVVSNPKQYSEIAKSLKKIDKEKRQELAAAAFAHTAKYDSAITNYLGDNKYSTQIYERVGEMRYGENPHQAAELFHELDNTFPNVTNAEVLQGKALSFNNLVDSHR